MSTSQPTGPNGAPSPLPTPERYELVACGLSRAIDDIETLGIAVARAIERGATQPTTLADVGALYAFADDITDQVDHIDRVAAGLREKLADLNMLRLERDAKQKAGMLDG